MTAASRPIEWAAQVMHAQVLAGTAVGTFTGAAADSREVTPGRMFFALPGERVDGFDFCAKAASAGAAALVVDGARGIPDGCQGVPVLGVANPRTALGSLARAVRDRFEGRVVGITGSNGKTTTKELVAAALSTAGSVLRTQGNRNTDVGLPLTVLDASEAEAFWVLEMAMRARGEIATLAAIASPHVGVVTNVSGAHLERLGTLDEVARAKGEIFHGLAQGGIGVLPADDGRIEREAAHLPEHRKLRFAFKHGEGRVCVLDYMPAGEQGAVVRLSVDHVPVVVRLGLPGEHNARNAAAAMAVVLALRAPVLPAAKAMETAALPPHRSRLLLVGGRKVLDDCYNANPTSMLAAMRTVSASAGKGGRAFALLGDMLEVGHDSEAIHADLGRRLVDLGFSGLAAVGDLAVHMAEGARAAGLSSDRVVATTDPVVAADKTAEWSREGDWVLVKASRGMRLERAIEALEQKVGQ